MSGKKAVAGEGKEARLVIAPPRFQTAEVRIRGTAPYVQHKFGAKAREKMRTAQEAGSQAKKGKKREPRDFQKSYEDAMYRMEGGHGIPAAAFRNAMISACRMAGFKMTIAKMSVFVEADGFDVDDGTPLVQIIKGKPEYLESAARNANGGCDLRARPMWRAGWEAKLRIRFDADQFSLQDAMNLLMRVGMQVGVGEGRPDSPKSAGLGWGLFMLLDK